MKILHISSAASWRGGERQVLYLMEGLQNNGIQNVLMAPKNSVLVERCNTGTCQILEFKKGIFALWQNIKVLSHYCNEYKIDLIHGHDSHAHTLIWMAYKLLKIETKSIVTRRLIRPIKSTSSGKYNCRRIEKIICISNAVKNAMEASIENSRRLEVIHSGIDLQDHNPKNDKAKEKEEVVIGYVAAFTDEKDHHTFIAAAKYLMEAQPQLDYKFFLVGTGPLVKVMKKKTENLKDYFTFTGFVTDMKSVYSHIDILLHTSTSEALGTSILDAIKHHIPIVATRTGGIPEIIDNGQNGFLCEVGDFRDMASKIEMLAKNAKLRQDFIAQAQKKLLLFDKSIMIRKTIALYRQVLNS